MRYLKQGDIDFWMLLKQLDKHREFIGRITYIVVTDKSKLCSTMLQRMIAIGRKPFAFIGDDFDIATLRQSVRNKSKIGGIGILKRDDIFDLLTRWEEQVDNVRNTFVEGTNKERKTHRKKSIDFVGQSRVCFYVTNKFVRHIDARLLTTERYSGRSFRIDNVEVQCTVALRIAHHIDNFGHK